MLARRCNRLLLPRSSRLPIAPASRPRLIRPGLRLFRRRPPNDPHRYLRRHRDRPRSPRREPGRRLSPNHKRHRALRSGPRPRLNPHSRRTRQHRRNPRRRLDLRAGRCRIRSPRLHLGLRPSRRLSRRDRKPAPSLRHLSSGPMLSPRRGQRLRRNSGPTSAPSLLRSGPTQNLLHGRRLSRLRRHGQKPAPSLLRPSGGPTRSLRPGPRLRRLNRGPMLNPRRGNSRLLPRRTRSLRRRKSPSHRNNQDGRLHKNGAAAMESSGPLFFACTCRRFTPGYCPVPRVFCKTHERQKQILRLTTQTEKRSGPRSLRLTASVFVMNFRDGTQTGH